MILRIDSMREVRGELPMEVSDLEDEMAGLNKRYEKIEEEIGELNSLILDKKNIIEESKITIKKYLSNKKMSEIIENLIPLAKKLNIKN